MRDGWLQYFYFYKTRNSRQSLGHLDQTLSCNIPLQIGILFDAEVCSNLTIHVLYIVLHMTSVIGKGFIDKERRLVFFTFIANINIHSPS